MSSMLYKDAPCRHLRRKFNGFFASVVLINDFIVKVTDKVCSSKNKTSCYLSSKRKRMKICYFYIGHTKMKPFFIMKRLKNVGQSL